jgi:hypothetical protein
MCSVTVQKPLSALRVFKNRMLRTLLGSMEVGAVAGERAAPYITLFISKNMLKSRRIR